MNPVRQKLENLRNQIEKLKKEYDLFFLGVSKTEPLDLRKEVENKLKELSRTRIVNTADRFFLQTLTASYTTYSTLWNRKMNEMLNTDKTLSKKEKIEMKRSHPAPAKAEKDHLDKAIEEYIEAHKKMGLSVKMDREKLKEQLQKAVEDAKKKYNAKDVKINVKISEGKVKFTLTPQK